MDIFANRTIKGYEIRERIGTGGFGAVYRAFQPAVGREVAIKVILPERANNLDFIRRFEVEAQLIARLEHPHIVPLYDYWRDPEGAFLVMRWLMDNLRSAIQRGPWSVESAARLLDQIAGALQVSHRDGVIHRDIKPDNILLDEDENAYLADFGIAKDGGTRSEITIEGAIIGSPAYVTPEQIRGEEVTPRTDIYSLGIVMYEILIGEQPFAYAHTPLDLINHHLHTPLPPIHVRRNTLSAALNEVLQTASAKDPVQRYPNALRFAQAFRAALPNLRRVSAQPLIDPLTERELDVLRLMSTGLSTKEIAAHLYLTSSTVRWYLQQIYSKLDVHSRHQAIVRAGELRLLQSPLTFSQDSLIQPVSSLQPQLNEKPAHMDTRYSSLDATLVNPYKGLRAFQESDTSDFFGRAALTEQLLARLAEQNSSSSLLVVIGPSGSGKSSVVRAGLIPALRRRALPNSDRWLISDMLPGSHPFEELEAALLRIARDPLPDLLNQLTEDRRGLVRAAKRVLPVDQDVELMIVIDQFEELFTLLEDEAVRTAFIDTLLSAITDSRSRVRVVLTIRADFYDRPLSYPRLAELVRSNTEVVLPLTEAELERAIVGPAERIGLKVEPALVTAVSRDVLEQSGALPLMQYTLTELFGRRQSDTITLESYRESGSITGALARRAELLYEEMDPPGQEVCRQLFLRLVTLGEGAEDTRRRVRLVELPEFTITAEATETQVVIMDEVISAFTQYRLLTLDRDPITHEPTVEVAHEALIRAWGRLREWLTDSREELHTQRRLMNATVEWQYNDHDPSYLATGGRLTQFETLAALKNVALNTAELDYLEASLKEHKRQQRLEDDRQQRELTLARQAAVSQRRSANRLRYLVGILTLFFLVAITLSGIALSSRDQAVNSASTATVAQGAAVNSASTAVANLGRADALLLAAAANRLLPSVENNAELAALLAIRSLKTSYSPEADAALLAASSKLYTTRILQLPASSTTCRVDTFGMAVQACAAFNPTLNIAAIAVSDRVLVRSILTDEVQYTIDHLNDNVVSVAISASGSFIAIGTAARTIYIWNTQTHAFQGNFSGTNRVGELVFTPNETKLLAGSLDPYMTLWDFRTGTAIRTFRKTLAPGRGSGLAAISPDGMLGISEFGRDNEQAQIWNLETGQKVLALRGHRVAVIAAAFSPNGKWIATSSLDNSLRLWEIATGGEFRQVDIPSTATSVNFSKDSRLLISGEVSGTISVWNVDTGVEIRRLSGHRNQVERVQFFTDTQNAISISADRTIRLWNTGVTSSPRIIPQVSRNIFSIEYSPDNNILLAASDLQNEPVRLWNPNTGQFIRTLPETDFHMASFSPNGRYILSAHAGTEYPINYAEMRLFDTATGDIIRAMRTNEDLCEFAFSPDGRYALGATCRGPIYKWEIATGVQVKTYYGHLKLVTNISISPDQRFMITSSADLTVRLWDFASGEVIKVFEHIPVYSDAVFADHSDHYLLTTMEDVSLYDANTGRVIWTNSTPSLSHPVFTAADNFVILSGNRTLYILDAVLGHVLRLIKTEIDITALDVSSDGKRIAIGGSDANIYIWDTDYRDSVAYVCSLLSQDFLPEDRERFGIVDLEPTCPQFGNPLIRNLPTTTPIPTMVLPILTPLPTFTPGPSPTMTVMPTLPFTFPPTPTFRPTN